MSHQCGTSLQGELHLFDRRVVFAYDQPIGLTKPQALRRGADALGLATRSVRERRGPVSAPRE
ncbi:MAG: hypothetical protein QNJ97_22705 [Myxococcota bacterium]|nr:hypothetical protein [Myxococcota bacterium]